MFRHPYLENDARKRTDCKAIRRIQNFISFLPIHEFKERVLGLLPQVLPAAFEHYSHNGFIQHCPIHWQMKTNPI